MALVVADRVKETTTTTGTGTYTLAGAATGFESFSAIGNANTTYYCCTDGTDFEVGIGTYTSSGTTLARTTILQSSNSDAAVNWSAGTRDIFVTQPAEKAVFLDGSDNISIPGTIDGRDLATDGAKLDGIEASADVTDTTNVTAAGALMDSEVTNLAQVKAFDSSDYATAAQGSTADSAMQDLSDDTSPTLGGALSTGGNQIQLSQTSGNAIVTTGSLSSADLGVLRASAGTGGSDTHGFTIKYMGSRSGNNNSYSLFMDNQTGTDVEAITVLQDGKVGILNTSPGSALDVTGEIAATSLDISGDVDVDGTLEADAITVNGTALAASATTDTTNASNIGSGTLPNARLDQQLQDVAGLAVTNGNFIVGDGSNFVAESGATARASLGLGTAATSATGDFATAAQGTTADAAMPKAGGAFTGNVTFPDDAEIRLGDSDDFKLFHKSSTNQSIINEGGAGSMLIQASNMFLQNNSGGQTYAKFTDGGAAELYHNAVKKLETTSSGVNVVNTENGGPIIDLISDDPADAADFSTEGKIRFTAENSASESIEYASMRLRTADVTDGTEDGSIYFAFTQQGTNADKFAMLSGAFFLLDDNGYIEWNQTKGTSFDIILDTATPTADRRVTLPDATGTVLTTGNSDTPTTTTSSSDADFVLVDDGGTMKKITPANLGITAGAASTDDATALAIALG